MFDGIAPMITSFNVTGPTSPYHTDSTTVSCSITAVPSKDHVITHYMFTETPGIPDVSTPGWIEVGDFTYEYDLEDVEGTVEQGMKTIYAWVRDSADLIRGAGDCDWIVYSTNVPVIANETVTTLNNNINVVWDTQDAQGGYVDAIGWLEYRVKDSGPFLLSPPSTTGYSTLHDATIPGLMDQTIYEVRIHSNAVMSDVFEINMPAATPVYGDVTWSGATAPDDKRWARGFNWDGGLPPAVDTNATATFATAGLGENEIAVNREVGNLEVLNRETQETTGKHTFDLGENRLTIKQGMRVGQNLSVPDITLSHAEFVGGTLQIGTDTQGANLFIDSTGPRSPTYLSTMVLNGTALDANFNTLRIGYNDTDRHISSGGTLDLTEATIAGGTLRAHDLQVAAGATNTFPAGYLLVGEDSGLQHIIVTGELRISHGHRSGVGRFGDPANGDKLPPDVSITIGSEASPGRMLVGNNEHAEHAYDGYLAASDGGVFTAYLTDLRIGKAHPTALGGTVDLAAMDSCLVHSDRIEIAQGPPHHGTYPSREESGGIGTLRLPQGEVFVDDLWIGTGTGRSTGLLELNNTVCTVSTSLKIGCEQAESIDTIRVNLYGKPAGIDLAEGAAFDVGSSGTIELNFLADNESEETYWALRWAGNKSDELQALKDAEKLVWDDTDITAPVGIYYQDGFTYVGVQGVRITEFEVTGDTGFTLFTRTAEVDVVLTGVADIPGAVVDGWQISETDVMPETWLGAAPVTYEIDGEPGMITLYAWVKDDLGNTASRSLEILYQPSDPVISNVAMTDNQDGTVTITWDTDVPAYGKIDYKLYFDEEYISTPFAGPVVNHSALMELQSVIPGEQHLIIITSNATTYETEWPLPDEIYPVGDTNQDCMVDLLDLVFVRNRLFMDPTDPANAPADVNEDGSIGLDDLIEVRNNLGAACE